MFWSYGSYDQRSPALKQPSDKSFRKGKCLLELKLEKQKIQFS